jgi:hypothetical protein
MTITIGECYNGFFSCSFIILMNIFDYFNYHQKAPDYVDCSRTYSIYKKNENENLYSYFFNQNINDIQFNGKVIYSNEEMELQFCNYKFLPFSKIKPFIDKYFSINKIVSDTVQYLKNKYEIDYQNSCGVFYRGNDKVTETQKPPYQEVVDQACKIKNENPTIKFIIQTDELEFLQYFLNYYPDSIYFNEIPVINNQMTTVANLFRDNINKTDYILYYIASIITFSKLNKLITTSGNGELFIMFFRNNADGVIQYLKKNEYIHGIKNFRFDPNQHSTWF